MSLPAFRWWLPSHQRPTEKSADIALALKACGLNGLKNERAAAELWTRMLAWSLCGNVEFLHLSWADVLAHVGISTNTAAKSRAKFFADLNALTLARCVDLINFSLSQPTNTTINGLLDAREDANR